MSKVDTEKVRDELFMGEGKLYIYFAISCFCCFVVTIDLIVLTYLLINKKYKRFIT